jgi:hypothetical protein
MSAHKRRYDEDEDDARSSKRHRSERTDRNEERSHRHADSGYTDKSNPFGDGNLTQRFEWRAKDKKLKEQGSDPRRMSKEQELEREEEIKVRYYAHIRSKIMLRRSDLPRSVTWQN